MKNFCETPNMVVVPMGRNHKLDLGSDVDFYRPQIVQGGRLPGSSIEA
jgi:hypothetical protein